MSIFLSVFLKMFFIFLYLVVVIYFEWITGKMLPDGKVKNFLLRKY